MGPQRQIGIELVPAAAWGTHFCLFYRTKEDLLDLLVPYFKAGLENNEFCMWVTSEPLGVADARAALSHAVNDLPAYERRGQIEILDYTEWYTLAGQFDSDRVLAGWVEKEKNALERGFDGLRLTGNTFWLEEADWRAFIDYEAAVDSVISQHHMIALCTYSLDKCGASEVIDVTNHHQFALAKRGGEWQMIESADRRRAAEARRYAAELEMRVAERTRQLQILNEHLVRSEERHRSLFESINEGFALHEILCDEQGKPVDYRFLDVNPAFERQTGLPRRDVLGKTARAVMPQLEDFWVETYGKVALTGEPVHFENYSAPLQQHYEVFAYRPALGQFAVLFLNVTERKQAQDRILNLNRDLEWRAKELETANQELESFSYSISHDLRTPLASIERFAALVLQDHAGQLPPQAERYIHLIHDNSVAMSQLVDGLLNFSRSIRQPLGKQTIDSSQLVRQVLEDLNAQQQDRRVELVIGELPPCQADPVLLKQVWTNLLSNALKFTRHREVARIEIGSKVSDLQGHKVVKPETVKLETVFYIRDNGVGFPQAEAEKLFGVFQRLHSEEEYAGNGVGLAIVERIIRRHGGRVWAEAEVDKGATFYFTLDYANPGTRKDP